jgi:hypothetical protein
MNTSKGVLLRDGTPFFFRATNSELILLAFPPKSLLATPNAPGYTNFPEAASGYFSQGL